MKHCIIHNNSNNNYQTIYNKFINRMFKHNNNSSKLLQTYGERIIRIQIYKIKMKIITTIIIILIIIPFVLLKLFIIY